MVCYGLVDWLIRYPMTAVVTVVFTSCPTRGGQQRNQFIEESGVRVKIQRSPGHANIQGNEIADRLAKEAAKEAEEMTDVAGIATQSDVRSAARESVEIKWQRRWEVSEKRRNLYMYRPTLKLGKIEFCGLRTQRALLQLQSGYCKLKEYQHKVGIVDSPPCECGAIGDIQHFLFECPNYSMQRETFKQSVLLICGIRNIDTELLFSVTEEDLKEFHPLILNQLDTYIDETKRF